MSLVAIGDNVTDYYVDLGQMFPGGNSVNVAVHAARSGTETAYVGVVGDDARGQLLIDALRSEGVGADQVRAAPGSTAYAVVRHVDGDRVFGPNDKGVSLFQPSERQVDFVSKFTLAHSSYCSGFEAYLPEIAAATRVSFDFNDRTDDGYADALLPYVWIAEFSAAHLSLPQTIDLLRSAGAKGPRYVIATRGAQGALLYDGTDVVHADAVPVEVTDTLGAGDAFIGRALHGLLAGESTDQLMHAASQAAATACRHRGGFGHGRALPAELTAQLHSTTPHGNGNTPTPSPTQLEMEKSS